MLMTVMALRMRVRVRRADTRRRDLILRRQQLPQEDPLEGPGAGSEPKHVDKHTEHGQHPGGSLRLNPQCGDVEMDQTPLGTRLGKCTWFKHGIGFRCSSVT